MKDVPCTVWKGVKRLTGCPRTMFLESHCCQELRADGIRMVTMRDVADRAGVSIATVSFLLNDTKPVTPATRAKIEEAMAELGYRRNLVARALASRRTHIIAMAYPALDHKFGFSAAEFFTSAADAARKQDY